MRIKISSDSTCDLAAELIDKYDIGILPLTIIMNEKPHRDGVSIHPEDIFSWVDGGGELCTTTAPGPVEYEDAFRAYLEDYDALIHINIGSGFSVSHQNAVIAGRQFENVYVVDSYNLSTGQGHLVLEAAKLAGQGLTPTEIIEQLEDIRERIETSFVLSRLDYMVKGGRCSAAAAFGANVLKLKPCIEVVGNKMIAGRKYRGAFTQCLSEYVKDRLSGREDIEYERLFITSTPCSEAAQQAVRDAVSKYSSFSEIYQTAAGCTISCHCGPGCLGILFIRRRTEA